VEPVPIATFDHRDFALEVLLRAKARRRVTVCIPARDEALTIGPIVAAVQRDLLEGAGLVDEVLVVDDGSTDGTAAVAADAGATVVPPAPFEPAHGKGRAMARGLEFSTGDVVVFLDGDVETFGPHFVTGLLGPLLLDPSLALVKATYQRPIAGEATGGGRVTELVARPLLTLLFPELTATRSRGAPWRRATGWRWGS
jgi:glucosyl-3-phosphoglycerate synthase